MVRDGIANTHPAANATEVAKSNVRRGRSCVAADTQSGDSLRSEDRGHPFSHPLPPPRSTLNFPSRARRYPS
ncbi:hypothetical protein VTH06DRAFT_2769, partial [Thermothelomyces fergusii]